jgi:tetratricopeptide (TPR) repeat protein
MSEPTPLPDTSFEYRSDAQREAGPADTLGPDAQPSSLPSEGGEAPVEPVSLHEPAAEGTTPPSQPTGTAGRHLLFGEIGRGGVGVVLQGRDPDLERPLAIKALREDHRHNPDLARRFLEEAKITGQLQHPGIPPVHELGRLPDGRPYFAMKLVKGRTLADLLAGRADLRQELLRFLMVFEQVCQTVAYAHARRVIHRDLKPANVMVGAFGEVQVMDWGMAKVLCPGGNAGASPDGQAPEGDTVIRTGRSGSTAEASQPGTVLGTPSFMPPEQARGEVDRLDERADVFGLGALLCVILTGRPPYTGSAYEVHGRAQEGDLAGAFARLDGCGADAELVQLGKECLAAERDGRPRDAGAVAARVVAYQAGVQERLRRAELERAAAQERAAGERKRRKLLAGLAAASLALVVGGAGSALWLQRKEADRREAVVRRETELRQGVATDLQTAAALREQARWATARQVLARTRERLGETGPADLREQLGQATADLELAARLDDIRQKQSVWVEGKFDKATALREYPAAFAEAGLGRVGDDEEAVAVRVRGSAVKAQLVAALDDWASITREEEDRLFRWLMAVARRADPDPVWRDRFRDPAVRRDRAALERLAREAKVEELSPQVVTALGRALMSAGADAGPLLREAQRLHPNDFWLSFTLGETCLDAKKPEEAAGHFRAARALQPRSLAVRNNLGSALRAQGELEEAVKEFREALRLDPKNAKAHHYILGFALHKKGEREEAIKEYREALRLDPKFAMAHYDLGRALGAQGEREEAVEEYREALRLDPKFTPAHNNLGNALYEMGEREEAFKEYREALRLDPKFAPAHYNLGNALAAQGKRDEAIREYREAIRLDPKYSKAHTNLGIALAAQGEREEAVKEYREALRLDPKDAPAHNNLGAALYAQGQREEAVKEYREALRLDPKFAMAHHNLGAALYAQGERAEAIREYREALRLDPRYAPAHTNLGLTLYAQGEWEDAVKEYREAIRLDPKDANTRYSLGIALAKKGELEEAIKEYRAALDLKPDYAEAHCNLADVLRQQGKFAEALAELHRGHELGSKQPDWRYPSAQWVKQAERLAALERRLPEILQGKDQPADNAERLELAQMCGMHKKLYAASVRFFEDAFAADVKLTSDTGNGHRYNAARAAALAASGKGDGDKLGDQERTRLRQQAVEWLRADLILWYQQADSDDPKVREAVRQKMKHWQSDAELTCLRDQDAIKTLSKDERDACRKLWEEVAAVLRHASEPR